MKYEDLNVDLSNLIQTRDILSCKNGVFYGIKKYPVFKMKANDEKSNSILKEIESIIRNNVSSIYNELPEKFDLQFNHYNYDNVELPPFILRNVIPTYDTEDKCFFTHVDWVEQL